MLGDLGGAIEAAERAVRRSWKITAAISTIAAAVILALFAFSWSLGAPLNVQTVALQVIFILGLVISGVLQARYDRRSAAFIRSLAPRMRDVAWDRRTGVRVVFDNGLVLRRLRMGRSSPEGLLFGAFIAADGSVLTPNREEILPWARSFTRNEAVGSVGRKGGPEPSRAELEAIRTVLGSRAAFASLERHSSPAGAPDTPEWYASAAFVDSKWSMKADLVLTVVDDTARFLTEMPSRDFTKPTAPA